MDEELKEFLDSYKKGDGIFVLLVKEDEVRAATLGLSKYQILGLIEQEKIRLSAQIARQIERE